jgi:uroporphyrin-III C-methyltransferase
MAVKHLPSIVEKLLAAGRPASEGLAVVCNATLPDQFVAEATLATVVRILDRLVTPAIVVVGPVVALRQSIAWRTGPLAQVRFG